jgi:hypothetical protein
MQWREKQIIRQNENYIQKMKIKQSQNKNNENYQVLAIDFQIIRG